jgi:hypothetical protein
VAEDVENVNPALVARDEQGKPYTVRYEAVNAMLLNEFLKERRKVEKLEAMVAQQRKDFETAIAQVKAQVQKVSAQLELSKAARKRLRTTIKDVGFLKYWEIIADRLSKAGWSLGRVSAVDSRGQTIWIVDAHRDGK